MVIVGSALAADVIEDESLKEARFANSVVAAQNDSIS
jgi:hypothetical protein